MITLNALACAGLERLPDGEWVLHSRFSQAINFCHSGGELLTLFRYGKGMGPTGVMLSRAQFSALTHIVRLVKKGHILRGQGVTLCPRRRLRLQLNSATAALVDLCACTQQTGLSGALNQPLVTLPYYPDIIAQLERWYCGLQPDWLWLIGRGPGLTPSGDDILTGMMAVLVSANFSRHHDWRTFLPPADQLLLLTTSVSCSYLSSARLGEFSTPVLQVMRSLQSGRSPQRAIRRLLSVGHTSGADILLGIAIAQQWLQVVDSRRRHARSGNNTHIYSGG